MIAKKLHLVLKGVWFDKIASGEKTSEYREIKQYWEKPLRKIADMIELGQRCVVRFRRGYAADAPIMEFEIVSVAQTDAQNDLGMPRVWEIKLGKRIL